MSLLKVIEDTIDKIKDIGEIKINAMYIEEANNISNEYNLISSLNDIYSKYNKIKISWESKENSGYIELLSKKEILSKQEELIELSKEFIDDDTIDDIDIIAEDLRNWLPIFRFPNDDMFCIDRRNNKIVFFEHDVFDTGINLHGLIIAKSIEDLILKWSRVLFIDLYDWYDGVDEEEGIDLTKSIYKAILNLVNNY